MTVLVALAWLVAVICAARLAVWVVGMAIDWVCQVNQSRPGYKGRVW